MCIFFAVPGCVGCVVAGVGGRVGGGVETGLLIGSKSQLPSQALMFLFGRPSLPKITKQSCGSAKYSKH